MSMAQQFFAADDKFADVVAELEARGWRRLPFVGCPKFDLKWTNYSKIVWRRVTSEQIVNHLQHSILFSQKDRFTELLYAHAARRDAGQRQVDRCFPRTFDLSRPQDHQLLKRWFVYSQAVAVLKQSLNEKAAVGGVQVQASMRMARAAIANEKFFECWRHEDAVNGLGSGEDITELQTSESGLKTGPYSLGRGERKEVESILDELAQRDPQIRALGTVDSNVWICKPSNLSQGRGIALSNSLTELAEITSPSGERDDQDKLREGSLPSTSTKWIVQKYIERPLLLQNGRKFDIRQWVLITELEPEMKAFWFYKSYLRFCARKFELTRLQDRFTHLSNYSVQQHFVSEEATDLGNDETIADNGDEFEPMWMSEQFRDTLRRKHGRDVWVETILPQMQSIARLALVAVLPKLKAVGRGFEWLGFDFLVDENYNVWLLEVNVSPDVSHSTAVTAELVPKATVDALNVVLDSETSRSSDNGWLPFPQGSAS